MTLSLNNPYWNELAAEHRTWLAQFNPQYLANWEKLLRANVEAGLCEAGIRRILQLHGVTVEPNEDLIGSRRQPDFLCSKDGHSFYVEVTCISIGKVVEETKLPHPWKAGGGNYALLNDAFWSACKGKAAQCGNLQHPALVAIGTFHSTASMICVDEIKLNMLLTGETKIAFNIDVRTGSQVGDICQTTNLRSAVFLQPDTEEQIGFARSSIAGLLVCGLGIAPPKTIGILHPNPNQAFDRTILPDISFCEITIDRINGTLSTRWSNSRGRVRSS